MKSMQTPIPKAAPLNENLQKAISLDYRKGFGSYVTEETRNYILNAAKSLGPEVYEWAKNASTETLGELQLFNNAVLLSRILFFCKLGPGQDPNLLSQLETGWATLNRVLWSKLGYFFFPDNQL